MFKAFMNLGLGLLVLSLVLTSCEGFRRGYNTKYQNKAKENVQPKSLVGSALPNQGPVRRGLGISAWGIVTVIVSLVLAIAGLYYFSICYPIICQKNKKYDMIGLTSVA
nr:uncharacterized protein LOC113401415 [Vanessa tameamea]